MAEVRIVLAGLWTATMLTYLLGDVIRVFAGHFTAGEMDGQPVSQGMWLMVAAIMLVPIVMLVLTLFVPFPAIKWVTLVAAVVVILFNIAGLPYEGAYDNFLIGVSFVSNVLVIYYAWTWKVAAGA
jgi:putative exporter of polyketide antibiotics